MSTSNIEYRFKTNINCGGCIEKVSPFLSGVEGILSWTVDTGNRDKILSVQVSGASKDLVVQRVKEAGFSIEEISY
jgi:copper chaperone